MFPSIFIHVLVDIIVLANMYFCLWEFQFIIFRKNNKSMLPVLPYFKSTIFRIKMKIFTAKSVIFVSCLNP